MTKRSLKATEIGIAKAEQVLTSKGWSRNELAQQVVIEGQPIKQGIDIQPIHKFFTGKSVDRKYFVGICKALNLNWQEVVDESTSLPPNPINPGLDELIEDCDTSQYHEAIKNAHQRIWVYQTWLPGIERDATEICFSQAPDIRLLLLSFKESSPIYARLQGRAMKVSTAQHNSAGSVIPFVRLGKTDCVRFNYAHHPGWIAVIDSLVFWGPTPVHLDSHALEFLFHKHSITSVKGKFWVNQFELLWDQHSHSFNEEKKYNQELLDLR
jgi:DNA-binding Xre family transcriptional regulator